MEEIVSFAAVVGAVAQLAIALMLAAILYYLIDILRRARDITERVQEEGEEILEEIEEARENVTAGTGLAKSAGLAAEIVTDLMIGDKKPRKRKKSK